MIAGDELEIVRRALGLGEALEAMRLLALAAARVLALGNTGGLAAAATQIIELGAAHAAVAHHLDGLDQRRMDREDALDALAIGNLADGEVLVDAAAGAADAYAFIGLNAGALAFHHLDVDADGVAGAKFRHAALLETLGDLLFFELLQ